MSEDRFRLTGEVDLATVPQVRNDLRALIEGSDAHALIDCTGLTFIDSSGVAALLEAHQALEARGRHMLIVNVEGNPRRVFDLLGLSDLLHDDRHSPLGRSSHGTHSVAGSLDGKVLADS